MSAQVTAEYVRSLLSYNPETGVLTWRLRRGGRAIAGAVAGSACNGRHRSIVLCGRRWMTHRIIWLHVTGEWPEDEVDHVNRLKDDNRWANLRSASRSQNMANKNARARTNNLPRGVSRAWTGKYTARINFENRAYYLGTFDTLGEAEKAYRAKAKSLHGEFAVL